MERSQERFNAACVKLNESLNEMVASGLLGDGSGKGMIASFVAVAEIIGESGKTEMEVLFDTGRINVVMGNLTWANMYLVNSIVQR